MKDKLKDMVICFVILAGLLAGLFWAVDCDASDRPTEERIAVHFGGAYAATTLSILTLDSIWNSDTKEPMWEHHYAASFVSVAGVMTYSIVHNRHKDVYGVSHVEGDDIALNLLGVFAGVVTTSYLQKMKIENYSLSLELNNKYAALTVGF